MMIPTKKTLDISQALNRLCGTGLFRVVCGTADAGRLQQCNYNTKIRGAEIRSANDRANHQQI